MGVIAALVLVAGFPLYFMMGTPPSISDATRYADYLASVNGLALATKLVDTVYVAGFIAFLVGIRDLIRSYGPACEWAATLTFAAGLASAIVTLVGDVLGAAAALDTYSAPDPVVIRVLTEASLPAFGTIGLAMTVLFLGPANWAILATGALPRWTAWMGYMVAVATLIAAPTIFGGNGFLNATIAGGSATSGIYSYSTSIAGLAFIAWLLVVGVCMMRAKPVETVAAP